MGKFKIACLGEVMLEVHEDPIDHARLDWHMGGDALVTAVYLSRLLKDRADVHFVTEIGDDEQSTQLIHDCRLAELQTDMIHQVPGAVTGRYTVESDELGRRYYFYWNAGSPFETLFQTAETADWISRLAHFDLIYFSGPTLAALTEEGREKLLDLAAAVRKNGGQVAFDGCNQDDLWPDPDQASNWVGRGYQGADIALPTYDDDAEYARLESGSVMLNRFLMMGCREVVIKRESEPYFLSCLGEQLVVDPGDEIRISQDLAVGGSFNAGYLAGRLLGMNGHKSTMLGHQVAGRVGENDQAILPTGGVSDLRPY